MRPKDQALAARLEAGLLSFSQDTHSLPGIRRAATRKVLVEQLVDSVHRVKYVSVIRGRDLSSRRADTDDPYFDPLKAAILKQRQGAFEEAFWLVFIFVHFGRNRRGGWRYAREVYGRLGDRPQWDWVNTSGDPAAFRAWLHAHQADLKRSPPAGGFGNHRKYESLDAYSPQGTGSVVASYVNWIAPPRTHEQLIHQALSQSGGDSRRAFDWLYRSMADVNRFGRTARFDYLTMVGKMGLAAIEPGSPYIDGGTGPAKGAQLLLAGASTPSLRAVDLNARVIELDSELDVGMQVLEDALCNWQKSPNLYKPFHG